MDKKFEDELREEFKKILYDLAHFDGRDDGDIDDEEMCLEIYDKFYKLYGITYPEGERFRHYYSDIFIVLSNINNEVYGGDILNITSKIQRLFEYIDKHKQEHEFEDIVISKVKKLYDHLTLEKSRIDYTYSTLRVENGFSINRFRDEINIIQEKIYKIEKLEEDVDKLEIKTQNYQKEHIAILSIFSSVVLAFIGGITFSVSVLQNVHNLNIWIGLSVISLLGLVLNNILFILFSFIYKIINVKDKFVKGIYYTLFNVVMLIILAVSLINYFKT